MSVKNTQSSQSAFAEQAVLHTLASATKPICKGFDAALSMDPPRSRHSVKKMAELKKKKILYTLLIYTDLFTFVSLYI